MKEMEVGMKIDPKDGPRCFGLEQVNAAIKAGASVIHIDEGALITSKVGEDAENYEMAVTGFSLKVILGESGIPKKPKRNWGKFW